MPVRNIRDLAARVYLRLLQYRRRHPDARSPIGSDMSRILENEPRYQPYRTRSDSKRRKPSVSPSVFTVQRIAESLGTTVGDLLDEPAHRSPAEHRTPEQRRTMRDAIGILRGLFDLDDPEL